MRIASSLLATLLVVQAGTALAASSTSGHSALALGVLTGLRSPSLSMQEKFVLMEVIDDKAPAAAHKITVTAKSVVCRAGDVDIAAFGCTLTFGAKTVSFTGRSANALFATLLENGVAPDGAAGTIYEAVHQLSCTLDPSAIAGKTGAGAECAFTPGA